MSDRFQVDLAGMVDLLSRHLYSGPQVYVRELIQNAVDAITARQSADPTAPAKVRISTGEDEQGHPTLRVVDTGIGLTAEEATELLATIGRSSKREPELGLQRSELIGQFGIGLLAAFMVANRIEVLSRSARPGALPIRWVGHANGTFEIDTLEDADVEVGTTVLLTARSDMSDWLANQKVVDLAADYASMLPVDVAVEVPVDGVGRLWRRITVPELPWRVEQESAAARAKALSRVCEDTFGFTPLGHIDLDLPLVGISGVAFILPQAVSPGSGRHRVYVKRMLLGPRVDRILPEWAFFARAVLDTDTLSPTASREQLQDDEVLHAVRDALGEQIRHWATATLTSGNRLARNFIRTHHLALRALAVTEPDMVELIAQVLPFETTDGALTLAEVAERGEIVYATTTEAYRRVATVARAQGLVVVNAGYVYDLDLLQGLGERPGWRVRELSNSDMVQVLGIPDVARELELAPAISRARDLLQPDDCDVIVRTFDPATVPAVLLRDSAGEHRRELNREREASPDRWGGLLDSFAADSEARTRTLVLNDDAEVVRRLLAAPAGDVFAAGLRSLYLSAVMLAGEGLHAAEAVALGDALSVLLGASLRQDR
ncbi:HSP90 family protein [Nocardioides sp.]|uniref:HSP90 family protein n=1 Tax=Nocardioides sp. TaxID=35761 RepID=UPI0039E324BD